MKTLGLLAALLFVFTSAAHAQQVPPYVYPATIGTASTPILPVNSARRRIVFYNPNATAIIAFCPVGPGRNGTAITCAVNGAGSITLLPYASYTLDGGTPSGPPLAMGSAWNAIANTASSAFTVLEFE